METLDRQHQTMDRNSEYLLQIVFNVQETSDPQIQYDRGWGVVGGINTLSLSANPSVVTSKSIPGCQHPPVHQRAVMLSMTLSHWLFKG